MRITYRQLWSTPFYFWSRRIHIVFSLVLLMTVLTICIGWSHREDQLLEDVLDQLAGIHRATMRNQAVSEKTNSAGALQRIFNTLPSPSIVDALQTDVSRFADSNRLQLVSLTTEHASVADPDTPRIVLQVSVRGDYPGIKSWLSDLLARYPTLSLQQLQLQNASQNPASGQRQETRMTLVLFVRAH